MRSIQFIQTGAASRRDLTQQLSFVRSISGCRRSLDGCAQFVAPTGIDEGQQLAHAGDKRELVRFPTLT